MDAPKSSAPAHPTESPANRLPDHELIRLDAAAHPGRTHGEHLEAAREIAGRTMFVFRSEDEAERYRAETGDYPAAEGWGAVSLTPEHMRGVLEIHEVPRVVFP